MDSWHGANLSQLRQAHRRPTALFLDDGGVLNDNRLRGPEWLRLIGEFMPPRLGGRAEQWANGNQVLFPRLWDSLQQRLPDFATHEAFQRELATGWVRAMCAHVGVSPLPDDQAVELYKELSVYVGRRASAEIAGAAGAVRALHAAGYTLYTASGTPSWELQAIVAKMGIAALFVGLYGPDRIDHVKYGPGFYHSVLADAGVAPEAALVIESDADCCRWAVAAGARAVWIDLSGQGDATTLDMLARALA